MLKEKNEVEKQKIKIFWVRNIQREREKSEMQRGAAGGF